MKAKVVVFVVFVDHLKIELMIGEGGQHVIHQAALNEIINSAIEHLDLGDGSEMLKFSMCALNDS